MTGDRPTPTEQVIQASGHARLVARHAVNVLLTEDRHEVTTDELHVLWRGEGEAMLVELAYSLSEQPAITFFRTFSEVMSPDVPCEVFTAAHLESMTSLALDPTTGEPYRAVPFDGQRTVHLRVVVQETGTSGTTVFKLVARVSPQSPRFRVEPSWAATT